MYHQTIGRKGEQAMPPHSSEKRERKALCIKMAVIHLSALLVVLVFLRASKWLSALFPHYSCVMVKYLGIYCPGCGGTRAVRHLVHFSFGKAFMSYPPLFFAIAVFLQYDILAVMSIVTGDMRYVKRIKASAMLIVVAAILVLFVLRNVALYAFDYDYLGDIL